MKDIFNLKRNPKIRLYDMLVKHHKSARYGDKILIALGSKIWNQLPSSVKSVAPITKFKGYIRKYFSLLVNVTFQFAVFKPLSYFFQRNIRI